LNQIHSNTKFEQNFNHINLNQNLKWLLFEIILKELQQRTVQLGYIGAQRHSGLLGYKHSTLAQPGGLWPAHAGGARPMRAQHARCAVTTLERGQRAWHSTGVNNMVEGYQ
jgi:hypothetical protein